MQRRQHLNQAKRIVVKVGTSLLARADGTLNTRFISKLSREIAELHNHGREMILVTSGAVGAGLLSMQWKQRPRTIPAKQAMAAIGQPRLMQAYAQAFGRQGLKTAQVLLTSEDIHHRQRYANAHNTLQELLALGVIPIFNENDTVSVNEIKFGDNDELSAQITNLAEADVLIILTDVDGLYTHDPRKDPQAQLVSQVEKITREIEKMALASSTMLGTGGMITKLLAAKKVTSMGEEMVIANGRCPRVLLRILAGEPLGTIFYPQGNRMAARKRWIAFSLRPSGGVIFVDDGAARALVHGGKSLLPSGITKVAGHFMPGDCVEIKNQNLGPLARGLVKYDSAAVEKLCGVKSSEIERILGYKTADEIIHRDDLVLLVDYFQSPHDKELNQAE